MTIEAAKAILRNPNAGKQAKGVANAFLKRNGIQATAGLLAKKNGHEKNGRRGRR